MTQPEIHAIRGAWPFNAEAQRTELLSRWQEKHGEVATYRSLCEAFYKAKKVSLVEKACDILQSLGSSSESFCEKSDDEVCDAFEILPESESLTCSSAIAPTCSKVGKLPCPLSTELSIPTRQVVPVSNFGPSLALAPQPKRRCREVIGTPSLHPTPQTPKPESLDYYIKYLRDAYGIKLPGFYTLQWPPPPTKRVFNLAMIHSETVRRRQINEDLVRLTQIGRVDDIVKRKSSVQLQDIFKLDDADRKVILIEGAPGVGKSTLAWHVCQKWKAHELFKEFKLVIFVQLRDPRIQAAQSIADLLFAGSEERRRDAADQIKACEGRGVLFVLDGWDEFEPGFQKGSIVRDLICDPDRVDLLFSTLLITSRPIASAALQRHASSRVEIVGFTPCEVSQYFQEVLKDPVTIQTLRNQLRERPTIEASCYLPLNAAIVTHIFQDLNDTLPTTLHGVWSALVCGCIIRHVTKQSGEEEAIPEISSLDKLPSEVQEPFQNVCILAYEAVMRNKATFSSEDLLSCGISVELNALSLMQGVQLFHSGKSTSYYFLHLSVQELLAAFHISKLSPPEQVQIFQELFNKPRFAAVFRSYAAFTKLQTEGIRDVLANIAASRNKQHLLNLLHCLYEAQDLSLSQFVASQLHGALNLCKISLSPLDCLAVGYFLSCACLTIKGEFNVGLTTCSLDDYRISFFAKELSKCCHSCNNTLPGHLALNLKLNKLRSGGVQSLSEVIHNNPTLISKLDLMNKIQNDKDGLVCLLQVLKTNPCIVEVALEHCSLTITADNGQLLVDMLTENTTLRSLELDKNPDIGDNGVFYVAKGLCHNTGIERLSLWECGITEEGAKSLADMLVENKTLHSLNVKYNDLGNDGIAHISNSLTVNTTLQELNISECNLTADGIAVLVHSLSSNSSLSRLDLSWNTISDTGACHIATLLKQNQGIRRILLHECGITEEGKAIVEQERKTVNEIRSQQGLPQVNINYN